MATVNLEQSTAEAPPKLARRHYSEALRLFNSSVDAVTKDQVDAVFCFAVLILLTTFSLENLDQSDESDPIDGFSSYLRVLCGSVGILAPWKREVFSGKVGVLLRHLLQKEQYRTSDEVEESLACLSNTVDSHAVLEAPALIDAISKLRVFYSIVDPTPKTWSFMQQWPISLSSEFVELLGQAHPAALTVFAHWCVAVHNASRKWFFGNYAERVVRRIGQQLQGSAWEAALRWPVSQVLH